MSRKEAERKETERKANQFFCILGMAGMVVFILALMLHPAEWIWVGFWVSVAITIATGIDLLWSS